MTVLLIPIGMIAVVLVLFPIVLWRAFRTNVTIHPVDIVEEFTKNKHWNSIALVSDPAWSWYSPRAAYQKYQAQQQELGLVVGAIVIRPKFAAEGKWSGLPFIFGYGTASPDENRPPAHLVYIKARLPTALDGWARLRSSRSEFRGLTSETDLESNHFNRDVQVHSYPRDIAFKLFAPDFMAWYLDLSQKPWLSVNKQVFGMVYEGLPTPGSCAALYEAFQRGLRFIQRSGAMRNIEVSN